MQRDGDTPLLVGGTHYYVEALLWRSFIGSSDAPHSDAERESAEESRAALQRWSSMSAEERHAELARVDAPLAAKLHANDERRVLRALQVFAESRERLSAQLIGGELAFARTCVLWVDCAQDVLDARLDARVEAMMRRGLLDELLALRAEIAQARAALPANELERIATEQLAYPFGVQQAIGYKEFDTACALLEALGADERAECVAAARSRSVARNADVQRALEAAVEQVKLNTRRYARSQRKWIRKRFVEPLDGDRHDGEASDASVSGWQQKAVRDAPVFRFDSSDSAAFVRDALPLAGDIANAFVAGTAITQPPLGVLRQTAPSGGSSLSSWTKYECDVCSRTLNGDHEWNQHLNSNGHKRNVKKQRYRQEREASEAARKHQKNEDS